MIFNILSVHSFRLKLTFLTLGGIFGNISHPRLIDQNLIIDQVSKLIFFFEIIY